MLMPLAHWQQMRHLSPEDWALAWRLRAHPAWVWRSGMGLLYPDGSYAVYQGFLLPHGEPLPFLANERTAGCLMGLLAETGEGWIPALTAALARGGDWRMAVARALLARWEALYQE